MTQGEIKMAKSISEKTFAEQSYTFAKISEIAYMTPEKSAPAFKKLGFTKTEFIDVDGSQAYVLWNTKDIVIACRGTEPTEFKDIKADLQIKLVKPAFGAGKVHYGFKESTDDIWPELLIKIPAIYKKQTVWCTGHSLGGAMATLIANRLNEDDAMPDLEAVFSYGSPMTGTKEFVQGMRVKHHRWVNGADIVPKVPGAWYEHHGELHYMNHWGNVREMTAVQRFKDQMRGFIYGWKQGLINFFINHSIERYSNNLARYAEGIEREQSLFGGSI